jgi:4-amino-4-deoxy-L-arabinose transferase-like glycosyltransferase
VDLVYGGRLYRDTMKMPIIKEQERGLVCVIVLAVLLTLPWLERPFQSRGEPREALVAQSMVVNSNWISPPAYNGAVPSKPPFNHWLISLASLAGGEVTEFTSRLPSAIAVILFSGAFYVFLARRTSIDSAFLASLILLSSFEWFRGAVTCRVDTLLSTSMAGALLALFTWRERGRAGFPWLAAGLISCAGLTKGPVGIALPLTIFSLFEFLTGEKRAKNVAMIAVRAGLIALPVLGVVSLWYVAGYLQRGDVFLEKIYYENFQRLTSSMVDEPHKHATPYMFLMLALGLLPWTVVWLTAAVRLLTRKSLTLSSLKEMWSQANDLQRFAFVASSFIFVFFCIPSSKRSVYIMPAYPFIAILAAESVSVWGACTRRLMTVLARVILWFSISSVCLVGICSIARITPEASLLGHAFIESLSWWSILLLIVCSLIVLVTIPRAFLAGNPARQLGVALVAGVVMTSVGIAEPVFSQLSPKSWASSGELASALNLSQREKLYSFGSEAYSSSFYLKKPFFVATAGLPSGSIVFVEQRNLNRFKEEVAPQIREIARFSNGLEPSKKDLVVVEVL